MHDAKQITANLHQIPVGGSCAFLVVEDKITVIDAGRRGSGPRIIEYISRLGHAPEEISYIMSTHYHLDHIGGIAHIQAVSESAVAVHTSEVPFVQGDKPLPGPFQNPLLAFLMSPLVRLARPPFFSVDICLQDGDMLEPLGGMQVVHTPGHTPGSISLYSSHEGLLIAGDALELPGEKLQLPSRRFTSDMTQAKESVRRLAELDFEVLCLSHYPPLMENACIELRRFADSLD